MQSSLWKQTKGGCQGAWTSLVNLLFPGMCIVCGDSLVKGEEYICTGCLADFPFANQIHTTGGDMFRHIEAYCCPERFYTLFYYSKYSNYKNLIYRVKYHSHRRLGVYLGRMLGMQMAGHCQADCIIPIPLHRKRERERGFNQAFEIAKGVSEVLGVEIFNDVVFRIRNNGSQTQKNAGERLKNTENIFELRDASKIEGRHILLLDDVVTTGATVGSCLQVLSQARQVTFSLGCLAQVAIG